jgi:hypothetical protein
LIFTLVPHVDGGNPIFSIQICCINFALLPDREFNDPTFTLFLAQARSLAQILKQACWLHILEVNIVSSFPVCPGLLTG